jgi:site-specific DNA-methyltransferase (adenine-specific)
MTCETIGNATLYLGDCLTEMDNVPDKSIDMILCDLPYGTTACKWDTVIPFEPLWKQYKRIIKDRGAIVLFGSQPFTSALVMSNPAMFKYDMVWNKGNTTGFLNAKKMPLRKHEDILVFSKSKNGHYVYVPQMRTGVMSKKGRAVDSEMRVYGAYKSHINVNDTYYPTSIIDMGTVYRVANVHPTQKPVALLEYLIKTYTIAGETVLDNTMGSGSTGVACVNTGRNFIGIELDPGYFDIARTRIAQTKAVQMELAI